MTMFNISYSPTVNLAQLTANLNAIGTVIATLPNLRIISFDAYVPPQHISSIAGVTLVELDVNVSVQLHADEWNLLRLVTRNLPVKPVYNPTNDGSGVVVYLVDSGVDATHVELAGQSIVDCYSFDGTFTDTEGHGTSLASLINGKTLGASKGATVKSVKIPISGNTTVFVLLSALDAVLQDHLLTSGVKVVNCSWTVPKSQLLDNKITELQSYGLVVVAAAGNDGVSADTLSPVGLDSVIGVAASDQYDRVIAWGANSSNWGPDVDVTAPGISVYVAIKDGGLALRSGTSLSAAIVSAVVAQYIVENPTYSSELIKNELVSSATPNILFRNETIYKTTPNRLVTALFLDLTNAFELPANTLIPVKRGDTTVVPIHINSKIVNVVVSPDAYYGGPTYVPFDWISVSFVNRMLTLTISPPTTIDVGKYTIVLTATDDVGNTFKVFYPIGVFVASPTELDPIDTEQYQTTENGNTVLRVTPALCVTSADCPKATYCCSGHCVSLPC